MWLEWAHFKGVHKSCCHASKDRLHPPRPPVTHPPTLFSFSPLSSSLGSDLLPLCISSRVIACTVILALHFTYFFFFFRAFAGSFLLARFCRSTHHSSFQHVCLIVAINKLQPYLFNTIQLPPIAFASTHIARKVESDCALWPQIFVINLPSAELSLPYKTPTKTTIEQSHVCFWTCLWFLHLLLLEYWICFCSMTTEVCDKFTIYRTLIIVCLTHQCNSSRCSNRMHFLLGKTHVASKRWIWLCGNLVLKNPSVEINHNRRTWGALGWQLADVIMYLKPISTGIKKQYSLWETMDLSEVHSSLGKSRKFRHPIASCSTLPEESGNPSGPYLPVSRTGISLSCSNAKHHSSSPPNSLSVIKCKVPAAVVKWRDDVKTGALVNTDSVVELCSLPSRPVYLFQSINQDARPTLYPTSFCLLLFFYIGVFLASRGAGTVLNTKQTQTKWKACWRHEALVTGSTASPSIKRCVNACLASCKLTGYMDALIIGQAESRWMLKARWPNLHAALRSGTVILLWRITASVTRRDRWPSSHMASHTIKTLFPPAIIKP